VFSYVFSEARFDFFPSIIVAWAFNIDIIKERPTLVGDKVVEYPNNGSYELGNGVRSSLG